MPERRLPFRTAQYNFSSALFRAINMALRASKPDWLLHFSLVVPFFSVFFAVVFAVLCIALFAVLLASDLRYYSRSTTAANYRSVVCHHVTQIVEDLTVHKLSPRPPSRRARGFPLLLLLLHR